MAELTGLTFQRVGDANQIDSRYLNRLGADFCKSHGVLPIQMAGSRLLLGVVYPDQLIIIDEVRHKLGMAIKPVVICRKDIAGILEGMRSEEENSDKVDQIIAGIQDDDVEVVQVKEEDVDLEKMAGESPVIRFVNYLIFNAVKEGR